MAEASFQRVFSAAHRLAKDNSPCQRIHGHNYTAQIEVTTTDLMEGTNFTVPFGAIKNVVDFYDHRLILAEDDPFLFATPDVAEHIGVVRVSGAPSTEFMAQRLAEEILGEVVASRDGNIAHAYVCVRLWETASIMATGRATHSQT